MNSNIFRTVKQAVTTRQVVEHLGLAIDEKGCVTASRAGRSAHSIASRSTASNDPGYGTRIVNRNVNETNKTRINSCPCWRGALSPSQTLRTRRFRRRTSHK